MVLAISTAWASAARASAPPFLFQAPPDSVAPGEAAGRLANPWSMAADPVSGHLYVGENANTRISEFTAWGAFVKAWGWDVAPDGAPGDTASDELEVCTASCQAGIKGDGAGQIRAARGLAIDPNGDIYVAETTFEIGDNFRVQKFSPEGEFLLMWGGEVNKTTGADLCTKADLEAGDECGAGVKGSGAGEFSNNQVGNFIAYRETTDTILVGDQGRIQEFEADGAYVGEMPVEGTVVSLAVDGAGNLYLVRDGKADVAKLDPGGAALGSVKVGNPSEVAVDVDGNVYAVDDPPGSSAKLEARVVGFDADGEQIIPSQAEEEAEQLFPRVPLGFGRLPDLATNLCAGSEAPGNLYVSSFKSGEVSEVSAYGTPPIGCEPPPPVPPEVDAQYAVSVETQGAALRAQIDPRFWDDTRYYVEYGTGKCSLGGCSKVAPSPPGSRLTEKVVAEPVTSAGVFLSGLQAGSTYHYRFVSESGGGGPVFGEDPDGAGPKEASFADGLERTFTTFPSSTPISPCSNDRFRTGVGGFLPDCRAYEMVSPLDKNNGDILAGKTLGGVPTGLYAAADDGSRLTYTSLHSFANPESAPYAAQYLAAREGAAAGWESEAISPPRTTNISSTGATLDNEFKGFSADLCSAWLRNTSEPVLAAGAVAGIPNLYRRENCGAATGSYEAVTNVTPPHGGSFRSLELQGTSADGAHAIYVAPDNLTADAPASAKCLPGDAAATCVLQLYHRLPGGALQFVCILPSGAASIQSCSAGTNNSAVLGEGRAGNFHNAISTDGSRVFWTASPENARPGKIYVRFTAEAKSRPVSTTVSVTAGARFWSAAADGSKAIFTIEQAGDEKDGNLYSFDVGAADATLIAKGVKGLLGASEDATHVYFASTEALGGANGEGAAAQAGQLNLYLYREGTGVEFIGTLAANDGSAASTRISPLAAIPNLHTSRVSPDGLHAVFMSRAALTGYDNKDANSGQLATQVFLYDAEEGRLACLSCNPSGARASGRNIGVAANQFWVAAKFPPWDSALYGSRVISDDGSRVFFESYDALVPRDTNGVQDVYQWEEPGAGSCDAADSTFGVRAGGCVDLISSGKSPRDSIFLDAGADGDDVFFTTLSSLVSQDFGLVDVYDARVGGGFPPPPPPAAECEGEACQSPPAPPERPTPASSTFRGPGNSRPKQCRKAKRRVARGRKSRCVRKRRGAKKPRRERARR